MPSSKYLAAAVLAVWTLCARAELPPRPVASDSRVKVVPYSAYDVVPITSSYFHSTLLEFGADETVKTAIVGDSTSWQVVAAGNLVTLKPIAKDAPSNLIVVTSRRNYTFSLASADLKQGDARLTFKVKFTYPEDELKKAMEDVALREHRDSQIVRPREGGSLAKQGIDPTALNLRYSFTGSKRATPMEAFDDGRFTYFSFADVESVPAVFFVDSNGNESLVNHRAEGKYLVVERVGRQFTMRLGDDVACVYNDSFPTAERTRLTER